MTLTTRTACEHYARLTNLEASPDELCALIHPQARWVTKWWNADSGADISATLRKRWFGASQGKGLSHVTLLSGHLVDDGEHVDCAVSVSIGQPDKHDSRTYFTVADGCITHIYTYSEWLDRTWPHPKRLRDKLAELICKDIPINPDVLEPKPAKLVWPNDRRNQQGEKDSESQARLQEIRRRMAKVLDADPEGTEIPDLGLE